MLPRVKVDDRNYPHHNGTGTLLGFVRTTSYTYAMVAMDGTSTDHEIIEVQYQYCKVIGYRSSVGLMDGVK